MRRKIVEIAMIKNPLIRMKIKKPSFWSCCGTSDSSVPMMTNPITKKFKTKIIKTNINQLGDQMETTQKIS